MAEIKCPNCGTIISLEAGDIESVVKQVRDEEFARDLEERAAQMRVERDQAITIAKQQTRSELQEALSAKDSQIAQLEARMREQAASSDAQAAQADAQHAAKLAQLEAQGASEVAQLKAQIAQLEESQATREQLAVAQAVAASMQERDQFAAKVQLVEAEKAALEARMSEQLLEQARSKDEVIAYQQGEIDRLKDMKSRLSTKMVGESLELHCLNEFNRIRAAAFPRAYFEKDNEVVEGTKGDFIFRECDEDGTEIVSIMFEMKNEEDTLSKKKTNEDYFAKLDKDRTKKGCEYAVLVSLLEPESELYNGGIVDVSYRFPKMYVVRPQFFIPIITLLRNAALSSVEYKREVALMKRQNIDITNFEHDLDVFKSGFFKNFGDASARFDEAVKAIDKAIDDLQKAKEKLIVSEKHLSAANNKLEGLTVKKLVRKNPTMRDMFSALEQGDAEGEEPADEGDVLVAQIIDDGEE